ncbi:MULTISPECIES: alpha/beta hydrolase [Paenibacillus]|uniref:alpha/beta hydrolase n=1 Tax=Paenibacillus TaxID=44249 RepID=UPI0022B86FD5|nr:alpha/beta hydrolase [Paenibacillus caseinilyticus]MCZ8519483.1 alpha/beta hydrolase [Paenibacillus caseinilyticus]
MNHYFERGTDPKAPVLVLFHGTGGSELDMVPLAKESSPESTLLSLRGNVRENGMPRFFRRLAEGVFDEADLIFRTQEVYAFLDRAAEEHGLARDRFVAVGYSNGANIAGSLLFHYRDAFQGAILHHPMVPLRGMELPALSGIPVFIGAGTNDPISPVRETEELRDLLAGAGADVALHWERYGHQLTNTEVAAAKGWFHGQFAAAEK